jgi:membrane protease YdiL (CAAX protease family)
MLGLIVELIISWLLLWIFCKKGLTALGIIPTKSRILNLFFGFLIAAFCCTIYYLSFSVFTPHRWTLNYSFTARAFGSGFFWALKSVLYEELLFRGALLYILIRKAGVKTACIISAVCFGIYHWFTSGAFGNPVQMVVIFIMTAIWGFMFAMAFAETKSLYLPIGLHFGWNLINTVVFSEGPLGKQLFVGSGGQPLGVFLSILVFAFQLFAVPLISYVYVRQLRKHQQL